MKRTATLLTLAALSLTTFAQTPAQTTDIDRLDSLAASAFNEQDYEKCLRLRTLQLKAMSQRTGELDSAYIMTMVDLGRCYFRMEQPDEAVKSAQQVADLYAKAIGNDDNTYANLLDNLALYQSAAKQYEQGLANCRKALDIYEQQQTGGYDLAVVLMHMAELSHYSGKNADAVAFELRSLNIIRQHYGEHSEEYLNEVPYLKQYYEANGEQEKADKLTQRIETLEEETENGVVDLPDPVEFKSADMAREHNHDAMRCIDYLLNHYVVADKFGEAARYIIAWTEATSDCHILIGENEAKLADGKPWAYFVAYLAGCGEFALKTGQADFTYDTFEHAMIRVLNYYMANKKHTDEVPYLEQYIKAHEKSRDELEKLLRKNFPGKLDDEMVKRLNAGEEVKAED